MSIKLMTAVWEIDLPASDKLVLLALADCANDEGGCWPSMATLVKKCSKGERTVQASIKSLESSGHITRDERPGKGCFYTVHPRNNCAPAKTAPPQKLTKTPAKSADKPSRTITDKNTKRALPIDWKPEPFGRDSQCRAIVDGWTPKELATQIEHFTAHHRGKGNRFLDWQDVWKTWVLNSRRFAKPEQRRPANDGNGSFLAHLAGQSP